MTNSNSISLFLALIAFILHSVGPIAAQNDNFLASFKTRSLVRVIRQHEKNPKADGAGPLRENLSLELEEYYDQSRKLAKLVVDSDNGERNELFIRAKDNLYLEVNYSPDGSMSNCLLHQTKPESGFFSLFNSVSELASKEGEKYAHFIGPAMFLYKFRGELEAQNFKAKPPNNANSKTDFHDEKFRHGKRLLIGSRDAVEFDLGGELGKITFKQSDFDIPRSPLLSLLALQLSYRDSKSDTRFVVDYLSIDEIKFDLMHQDLFKLPFGFECLPSKQDDLKGSTFAVENGWATRLTIKHDRLSTNIQPLKTYPEGANIMLDFQRNLLRFDIKGRSKNVLDINNNLIYHMPHEPALMADTTSDVLSNELGSQARNDECTIMSGDLFSDYLNDLKQINSCRSISSLNRWRFLVGQTNSIIYMGRSKWPQDGRSVHEFQLRYKSYRDLPPLFVLLITQTTWNSLAIEHANDLLIGKLLIESNEYCVGFHEYYPTCAEPNIIGFRVEVLSEQTNRKLAITKREEIQFSEFLWEFNDENLIELPFEAFELKKCPLKKLHLMQEVRWLEEHPSEKEICEHRSEFDDFIGNQLLYYLNNFAHSDVSVVKLNLAEPILPGIKLAKFSYELSDKPQIVIKYKLLRQNVAKSNMRSKSLDFSAKSKTLLDCLSFASQFGNSQAVLHSTSLGCLVYENDEIYNESDNISAANQYDLYMRFFEDPKTIQSDNKSGLKMLISEQLDQINSELQSQYGGNRSNNFETCTGSTLIRDVRMGKLKVIQLDNSHQHNRALGKKTTLLIRSGYRFVELPNQADSKAKSRVQEDSLTFVECLNKCDQDAQCASFAYCKYPDLIHHETCQLSDIKFNSNAAQNNDPSDSDSITKQLTRDAGCEIHAKNYLLYFESINQSQIKLDDKKANRWQFVSSDTSELDCAASCYNSNQLGDNDDYKPSSCTRFIHCKQMGFKCFHWSPTSTDSKPTDSSADSLFDDKTHSLSGDCTAYERKSMSLYRRTLNYENSTWFNIDERVELRPTKLEYMSKEKCAERCLSDIECQSFDSCFVIRMAKSDERSKNLPNTFHRFDCLLLKDSVYDGDLKLIDREKEEDSKELDGGEGLERIQCDHYEIGSAKQRLSSQQMREIFKSLSEPADKTTTTSYVTTLFGASIIGLTLGIGAKSVILATKPMLRRRT